MMADQQKLLAGSKALLDAQAAMQIGKPRSAVWRRQPSEMPVPMQTWTIMAEAIPLAEVYERMEEKGRAATLHGAAGNRAGLVQCRSRHPRSTSALWRWRDSSGTCPVASWSAHSSSWGFFVSVISRSVSLHRSSEAASCVQTSAR